MARIDLSIASLGNKFIDVRETIPGDSFNWSWLRPLSQVNYLAIHHSGASDTQTPEEIANFHIQSNGWGGIGYHFLIDKEGVVYYVGDILTARANVANLNDQVIGICLIGNFTDTEPSEKQIDSTRALCDFFINNYPDLSNLNSWKAVLGHKELPNQSTPCPGKTWLSWKEKIISEEGSSSSGNPDQNLQIVDSLKSQIDNLQNSLGLVNDQFINLQQTVTDKDQEIINLRDGSRTDKTLTIIQALINLYRFVFLSGKVTDWKA